MITDRIHPLNFTDQSPQMPCISGFRDNLNFSGFVGMQSLPKNSPQKSFSEQRLKSLRKRLSLKNLEESHRRNLAHDPAM